MHADGTVIGVYTELDVLLDTRIGTLALMGNEIVKKVLQSNYHTRKSDEFKDVDMNLYREMYKKRDIETLKKSSMTDAVFLLANMAHDLVEQAIARPYHDKVRITVNIYPYVIDKETIEVLSLAIKARLSPAVELNMASIPTKELTPAFCGQEYAAMTMYDYGNWLELQTIALHNTRIPTVSLFAPAIYLCRQPEEEIITFEDGERMHLLAAVEGGTAAFIELKLLDVKIFSIFIGQ